MLQFRVLKRDDLSIEKYFGVQSGVRGSGVQGA